MQTDDNDAVDVSSKYLVCFDVFFFKKKIVFSSKRGVGGGTLIGEKTENLHWVEKYRPNSLDDLIGQTQIVSTRTTKQLF